MNTINAKPFLKWAGGKSQLLPSIRSLYPQSIGESINKYCEPFVGGGAVLFDLLSTYTFKEILINDINSDLITVFQQVQTNVHSLILQLEALQNLYYSYNLEQKENFYYQQREKFNLLKQKVFSEKGIELAAIFIFLNKTCFNGLYRVNKSGLFNVPKGTYVKPIICDRKNLINASKLLQGVEITCSDYYSCIDFIDNQTFTYIDPPYRPLNTTSNFTSYDNSPFTDKEQINLSRFVAQIQGKGSKTLVSNSDPQNTNQSDNFFFELYNNFNIKKIAARRMINCNKHLRGSINELLIYSV